MAVVALAALAATACSGLGHAVSFHRERRAKLIEWGWDQPNTAYLREHIREMEQAPFDGVVLGVVVRGDDGKTIDFTWKAFGRQSFTREQIEPVIADLRATRFRKFTDNFLRFNVTPGDVDWFDDAGWETIYANARLAAAIAREGRLKGLMFDAEQYGFPLFNYQKQTGRDAHSVEEYARQVRRRGRELMGAINGTFPAPTILLPVAHSFAYVHSRDRAKGDYGLLPAFCDGLIEAATPKTTFVDGLEMAYPTKERAQFEKLRRTVREARVFSAVPELYDRRMTVAFGLWMDHNWRGRKGWFPDEPSKNHFSPDELKRALREALTLSDGYVWLYSEQINWWTGKGLSPDYRRAVEKARKTTLNSER